jgi:hypothetical protein
VTQRDERLARNEATFRAINEEIETKVHANLLSEHSELPGFLCECGSRSCSETVRMPIPLYEKIRRDPRLFFVVIGHEIPDIEDVVQSYETFLLVRKRGEAGEVAEATDPRGG